MSTKEAMERLGYTQEWIDRGVISEEFLALQYHEINNSEDQNAEHYRWGGFLNYIRGKSTLSDNEVENIFALEDRGPDDIDLHINRVIELIQSGLLTDEQFVNIANHNEILEKPIQKIYQRFTLRRKIRSIGIELAFDEVKSSTDTAVHEYVLDLPDIKLEHVRWLAENGANKRVRNIAGQMANSRRFRGDV
ncbi:hypothetical protein [Microbulbifer sp. ANSA005]|uniref:hypothetical protein n=1 Tax=Microbulbifer sp. ANSA005 TaxID=3243362 RepID=UPI00404134D3